MAATKDAKYYVDGIRSRDLGILSQAITLIESTRADHQILAQQILQNIMPLTGSSFRLGITGVPGVGKSTFIESFGLEVLKHGHRLAVLAIDPSSAKSKGSILGDKTRMENLSASNNAYIRPSPSAGYLGGVARATYQSMLLCEAAGYDFIMIETVGTGQSEITVASMTDFFLLLMLAGAGDELQGIKRGIMEMADALIITKADGDNLTKAKLARAEYAQAMHLFQSEEKAWVPRTGICSALQNEGIEAIYSMLMEYKTAAFANQQFESKRNAQQFELLMSIIHSQLKGGFEQHVAVSSQIKALKEQKHFDPYQMAQELLSRYYSSFTK
ncbi:MAG: methylmalonyl Co-A mutase-associated GTPase MeaB [Bacteroidota bacterium]